MGLRADTTHIKYFSRLDPPQEYKEGKNGLMFRLGIDIGEAALKQQWVKVALYSVLLTSMGVNLIKTQIIKYRAISQKSQIDALKTQVEMYSG